MCFYARYRSAAVAATDYSNLVPVAAIAGDPVVAARAYDALAEVRIPCTIEGSRVYGVSVSRDQVRRPVETLRQDAQRHSYAIQFH